jgi:hypothetical protein
MKPIEKLTYINERGDSIEFAPHSIYHVNMKDVTGLSDIRTELHRVSSTGQDGDTLISSRILSRDIEIVGNIKERDKSKIQSHRRELNRILNPHYTALLIYEFGTFKRVINCAVDNAPVCSRSTVYEQFTIQLFCASPYWREENETRDDIASWLGAFEFTEPAGLELDDAAGWEIEYREPSLIVNVINNGDVKTGLRAEFRAQGTLTNPSILNVNTGEFIKFDITMQPGDILTINTAYGEKVVKLNSGGVITDAFQHLEIDSTYLQLAVGDNLLRYDADTELDNLEVSIYHNNNYLGV